MKKIYKITCIITLVILTVNLFCGCMENKITEDEKYTLWLAETTTDISYYVNKINDENNDYIPSYTLLIEYNKLLQEIYKGKNRNKTI